MERVLRMLRDGATVTVTVTFAAICVASAAETQPATERDRSFNSKLPLQVYFLIADPHSWVWDRPMLHFERRALPGFPRLSVHDMAGAWYRSVLVYGTWWWAGRTPAPKGRSVTIPAGCTWLVGPGSPDVTDAGLGVLVREAREHSIPGIMLSGSHKLTDAGLAQLVPLTKLRAICLCKLDIGDAGLAHLSGLKELEYLSIVMCPKITDAGLASLKGLQSLKTLDLYGCTRITDAGFVHIRELSNLEHLDLSGTGVACGELTQLGRLGKLRILRLGKTRLSLRAYAQLSELRHLEWLDLSMLRPLDEDELTAVSKLEGLKGLDLACTITPLRDGNDCGLCKLKGLEYLKLDEVAWDATMQKVGELHGLKTLGLRQGLLSAKGLGCLKNLERLETLDLDNISKLDSAGIKQVSEIPRLRTLMITNNPLQGVDLSPLKDLARLRALVLGGACAEMTGSAFEFLEGLTNIEELSVNATGFSAKELQYLKDYKQLRWLDLRGTRVKDIKEAQLLLPNVEIWAGPLP